MTSIHLERPPLGLHEMGKPFVSRLELMQERLQAKYEVEKRQRLVQLADFQRIETRRPMDRMAMSSLALSESFRVGPGRVRQMFEERRKTGNFSNPPSSKSSPVGWDKSYPLDPLGGSADSNRFRPNLNSRGSSLDRSGAGYYGNMRRTQSQIGINKANMRTNKPLRTQNMDAHKHTTNLSNTMNGYTNHRDSSVNPSPHHGDTPVAGQHRINHNTFRKSNTSSLNYGDSDHLKSRSRSQPPPAVRTQLRGDQCDSGSDSRSSSSGLRQNDTSRMEREMTKPDHQRINTTDRATKRFQTTKKVKGAAKTVVKSSPKEKSVPRRDPAKQPGAMRCNPTDTRKMNAKKGEKPPEKDREAPKPGMAECHICYRHFNDDRIEKHRVICEKAANKKRKIFDVTKMRTEGTEAEKFVKKGTHLKEPPKPKKKDWRKQREEFITAIREARKVQKHLDAGGNLADLPPPPPSDNSDYIQCPHCGRKFNEGAAERHIPKCKNILSNKKR